MPEKQQTIETDSQASTGIINSCKSGWWAWESRGAAGRCAERKIHLNNPNQSNVHQVFCALCQTRMTLEPEKKHLWERKNNNGLCHAPEQTGDRGAGRQSQDGVVLLSTPFFYYALGQGERAVSAGSSRRLQLAAAGLLWGPPQETERRSEKSCRWVPPQPERGRTDEPTWRNPTRHVLATLWWAFVRFEWAAIKQVRRKETFFQLELIRFWTKT